MIEDSLRNRQATRPHEPRKNTSGPCSPGCRSDCLSVYQDARSCVSIEKCPRGSSHRSSTRPSWVGRIRDRKLKSGLDRRQSPSRTLITLAFARATLANISSSPRGNGKAFWLSMVMTFRFRHMSFNWGGMGQNGQQNHAKRRARGWLANGICIWVTSGRRLCMYRHSVTAGIRC